MRALLAKLRLIADIWRLRRRFERGKVPLPEACEEIAVLEARRRYLPAPAGGVLPDLNPQDRECSQGGDCEEELNEDCQPPDYHCSKCKRYMRAA